MDTTQFEDRVVEIESYIDLLKVVESAAQSGPPEIGNSAITTCQQRMLYSSVYLHLYNLVEATATWCTSAVTEATAAGQAWKLEQLDSAVRREWLRTNLRTHTQLNPSNRLSTSFVVCESILNGAPIEEWGIERGGGGNWDDGAIENISERVGCVLKIATATKSAAKRPFRDDKNAFQYVKELRNKLAHGSISFEQSGENVTVQDLVDLKNRTVNYLREVLQSFENYVASHMYLESGARHSLAGSP
ncbi:MAE_28990/MAE_18760 family HEPN-like nuclease [Fuerstiella marisgermanici]|uniref:MAE-28990/MAE-18760-like HEPN domain-containing protein n=1 Tax=Fuerstiella marisgermanici TaxID=1891926 RepID=A0A1P8WEE8_9PLAN|nr:MAE_28990/MAE_18760 family HEPN-like nuclease [Fuerstiella marisgermanici]APZ92419.1 hypothetical protein Fuma_02030 [Fuerstiella marisgermanici]